MSYDIIFSESNFVDPTWLVYEKKKCFYTSFFGNN